MHTVNVPISIHAISSGILENNRPDSSKSTGAAPQALHNGHVSLNNRNPVSTAHGSQVV